MVDGVVPAGFHDGRYLGDRHPLPGQAANLECQQGVEVRLGGNRDFQSNGNRVAFARLVNVGHVFAVQRHLQNGRDALLRNAEQGGPLPVDPDNETPRIGLDRAVDIDDVRRRREECFQPTAQPFLLGVIGAVDLSDDRRNHGRPGRYFDDLDGGAVTPANRCQFAANRAGDLVAGPLPVFLIDEVDLDVADVAAAAQVILPDQAVEIDRRCGAGVDLVVGDFRYRFDRTCKPVEQFGGHLDGGSFRHVHDDLELRLVIEGQHLEDDELGRSE